MARIEGVYLPSEKRVEYGLTYIYGIGLESSRQILAAISLSPDVRVKNLTSENIAAIQKEITSNFKVEGDLRKEISLNIKRLQEIQSYRGIRHKRGLPVRGQRTKTNARTRKGPRKANSVVANKKIAKK